MLGVQFTGHKELGTREYTDPVPKGTEVVVRVKSSAICGTDREAWEGEGAEVISGHEAAGEVVATDKPNWLTIGDRVAVNCHVTCGHCEHCIQGDLYFCPELCTIGFDRNGGNAEYLVLPEASCMPLPPDISFDAGALMVDMLGTPFRAFKRLGALAGDTLAIFGAGPIGLAALVVAKKFAMRVICVEMNAYRIEMAGKLGADRIVNPGTDDVVQAVKELTGGRGADAAMECVGSNTTINQALNVLRPRGKLALIGVLDQATVSPWNQFIPWELTMFGSRNFNVREYDQMVALIRNGLPVEEIVTHRFPLQDAEKAFSVFGGGQCGKVILKP